MAYDAKLVQEVVSRVMAAVGPAGASDNTVPVGVSNRHIHLSAEDLKTLYGEGYELTPIKDLSQPGQYACKELLTIIGPSMRPIENVRVLGPIRKESQVEISVTDSFVLKVKGESMINAGILPLTFADPADYDTLDQGAKLTLSSITDGMEKGEILMTNHDDGKEIRLLCAFTERQKAIIKAGGLLNFTKENG